MQFRLLGPLEVMVGDRQVRLRNGRPRALLLALLLEVNRAVPADVLIEHLWSRDLPQDPANALQLLVSYLRRTLQDPTLPDPTRPEPRVVTDSGGYRLVAPAETLDSHQFTRLVSEAVRCEDPAEKLSLVQAALVLWRGSPLPEVRYEPWAEPEVFRLEELHLLALDEQSEALVRLGREAEAVAQLQAAVAGHPTRERSVQQLMLALYRGGRQAEALEAYENLRAALADDLGVDPGPDLQRLHLEILQQAPQLTPERATAEPAADAGSPGSGGRVETPRPPAPLTRLLGRDHELGRLELLLAERRLLTVTGPGGAGKSRLVAEVAGRLHRRNELLGWADLAAARDADGATAAIVTALGSAPRPGEDPLAPRLLGRRAGVLVLDTCEHLVAELRPLVRTLLDAAPDVRVLATSRRPLGIPGELTWPLSALSLPDPADPVDQIRRSPAVQLLAERAQAVDPHFAVDGSNARTVARLCLMLDGLPLALELAAAQLVAVTPAKLVELLADRFRVLVGSEGGERPDALRATVDWSYALLDAEEAQFFDRLSVFAGSFPLEAAIAVAGAGLQREPFHLLLALVRQSLVTPVPDDRFRLLDTLRDYAAERLAGRPEESTATHRRHACWYAAFAREADAHLRGPDLSHRLEQLRTELADLRAALDWSLGGGDPTTGAVLAASLSWFWSFDGLFVEASRYLDTAQQQVDRASLLGADLLAAVGVQLSSLGRLDQAVEVSARAAEVYRAHGAGTLRARALTFVGIAWWGLGRFDESVAALDEATELFHASRDLWGEGLSRLLRARTRADDHGEDVRADVGAALALLRRSGDLHLAGLALEQLARAELRAGQPERAVVVATEACKLLERVGYSEGAIAAHNVLGLTHTAAGDLAQAEDEHSRALRRALDLDHPGSVAEAVEGLALVAVAADPYRALQLLGAADAVRADAALRRLRTQESVAQAVRARAEQRLDRETVQAAAAAGRGLDLPSLVDAHLEAADR